MTQKITRIGLRRNLGRKARTNFYGRRYDGILACNTRREEIVILNGAIEVPMRTNSIVCIENHRYHPGKEIWRTYKVSKENGK